MGRRGGPESVVGGLAGGRVEVAEAATEINGRLVFGLPKTNEKRTVYLAPRFVVDRLGELTGDRDGDALVFTTSGGTPLRSSNFRRGVWLPAVEAAGLPHLLMVQDLRDTAASLMISSGATVILKGGRPP